MNASSFPDSRASAAPDLQEAIRRRAEEIYVRSGRIPGRDLENWARAEQEIRREVASPARHTAVVIRVQGVQYVGEYNPESAGGYKPGEFGSGAAVRVRFEGDKMFVTRANGSELETRIVQKVG
ncbi:MAG TPA: DUF2934 domain-containing protein [Candidatus Sulfotelmatobacter sp.]|nr:DUF2934 domain-containing protein [Candidatus Sulfotelmatobacter sp.]